MEWDDPSSEPVDASPCGWRLKDAMLAASSTGGLVSSPGAVGGLLLSALFVLTVAAVAEGTAFILNLVFLGPLFAAAGAASAAGSLALARMAKDRELPKASAHVAEVGHSGDEAQELLGGRG